MWHFSHNAEYSPNDKLYKIQPLVDELVERFQLLMMPGEEVCIDETIVPFQRLLAFKKYIKKERTKFGIKLYKICL